MGSGTPLSMFGEELGIIPRVIEQLFVGIEAMRATTEGELSFLSVLVEISREPRPPSCLSARWAPYSLFSPPPAPHLLSLLRNPFLQ